MRFVFSSIFALAALTMTLAQSARAQDPAAFVVSYIEVAPASKDQAAALLKQFAEASRKDAGNARFEVLQRIDRPHQFAILEAWSDQKAQETHATAAHVKAVRDQLQPMLIAGYDERPHVALAVGPMTSAGGPGAIYAVTHVDFIPPKKDEGVAALKAIVEPSRKEAGNARFDALQQTSRPNHETLVEIWQDQKALDAHAAAAHMRDFRIQTLPMSGALYDERLYHAIK
jgi:quinol monooxygenase YgiN